MRLAFRERSLESLRFGDGDGLRGRTTYVALQGALEDELLSHLDVLPGFKNRWKEWLSFFTVASIRRGSAEIGALAEALGKSEIFVRRK